MAEWQSFRKRESLLGLFQPETTQGLVYPVRYADGDHFHSDAKVTQCRKDFSRLNYPDEIFRESAKYLEFDDLVVDIAKELVLRLGSIPPWQADFPITEPEALPPAELSRPVI
jgi:hypothetical protein